MKLRLQSNSIRLRLKRGEVLQLMTTGTVEEEINLGPGHVFRYVLESSPIVDAPVASLGKSEILVRLPVETAMQWAEGNEVSIEAAMDVGNKKKLQVLVEKDFACLNGTDEQNADTFPNPLAGTKC